MIKKLKEKEGFTLVELLVSIGIFAIISTIAVGGFINALRTHRQAMALMNANSNASAAIEQIAREIRTGTNFSVNGSSLFFKNAAGQDVAYNLSNQFVVRAENSDPFQKITDESVIVQKLNFTLVNDTVIMPNHPPRIIISISVVPKNVTGVVKAINIQTSVSSRNQ